MGASSEKWRGSIEHVSTKQRLFFTSLADVHDFIAARLTDARRAVRGRAEAALVNRGEVAEWLIALASKASNGLYPFVVQIPPSPPAAAVARLAAKPA